MSIIVTGGAGFIGSCIVRTLNDMGIADIIIVDNINTTEKWLNIRNKTFSDYIHKGELTQKLDSFEGITHVIHMGACSSTVERDFDYLYKNNYEYSKTLWKYCADKKISFIYASSAATYGDGEEGFDDKTDIRRLNPLNRYGYSKQLFDLWVEMQYTFPAQYAGLKFFNVYGPNEYAKGSMASMVFHGFNQIRETGKIKLYKSYLDSYADGDQCRDFIYVKDLCKVVKFLIENPHINGLYNLGTGRAESFNTLAIDIFYSLDLSPKIEYIDMPDILKSKYQYYTKAEVSKLKKAGYEKEFYSLNAGIRDYVQNYLSKGFQIY
jgi:ADP-L-glycero-D-manno-heptose-6-epimerase